MESWYDVLKKAMRIWLKGTLAIPNSSATNKVNSDIEDFYVYLYDEEDTST